MQNKFMGKSFEIRPTGLAHVKLALPSEEKEYYTCEKVTSNVSGFILGLLTIDYYGDMAVRNHRTGDRCVLTFKPRGWGGKDAFEITGQVVDARGNVAYDIADRWNEQLVARPRAVAADPPSPTNGAAPEPEFVLLRRDSDKPPGMPFNLTPYAITLNDCPVETLWRYLVPTDCRLRPDQRAFEVGQYELANTLKVMQEEKQRAVWRAREEGWAAPHRPRWFVAGVDANTGERMWSPVKVGALGVCWNTGLRGKGCLGREKGTPPASDLPGAGRSVAVLPDLELLTRARFAHLPWLMEHLTAQAP